MIDYLIKIGNTKLRYILSGGYQIQENQDIVLAKKTMADGTVRKNIAEKKKTIINITFSQIDGATLKEYNELWKEDVLFATAEEVVDMIREVVCNVINDNIDPDKTYDEWDLDDINAALNGKVLPVDTNFVTEKLVEGKSRTESEDRESGILHGCRRGEEGRAE